MTTTKLTVDGQTKFFDHTAIAPVNLKVHFIYIALSQIYMCKVVYNETWKEIEIQESYKHIIKKQENAHYNTKCLQMSFQKYFNKKHYVYG